ncbi:MAG: hypothetical protein ABI239_11835 [Aquihabitans sp.]
MTKAADRPDPWHLRGEVRPGEGLNVLGYFAGMAATAAIAQAWIGNNDDRWVFSFWALAFAAVGFWLFRVGTRRGAGRPWGFLPILGAWGLLSAGQQNESMTVWVGWGIGLMGLIGTNLIRLVAERFEDPPIVTPVGTGPGNVDPEHI